MRCANFAKFTKPEDALPKFLPTPTVRSEIADTATVAAESKTLTADQCRRFHAA